MFPLGNKTRLDLPLLPLPIEKVPRNLSYLANVTSRQSGQSISFSAYTFSCLQSPVFQSLRSASLSTCAVCRLQHNSVLSVKRTRTYIIPSSKTCSAQSTILPWTPGYCLGRRVA